MKVRNQGLNEAGAVAIRGATVLLLALSLACISGCTSDSSGTPATQPATAIDPRTAEPGYWYDQPGVVSIENSDFDALWKACKLAARDDGFTIDRPGYRDGVMTTQPLVSKQVFQPWMQDVQNQHDLIQSTLSTMRRTIRVEINKTGDGPTAAWQCVPKALVERYQEVERRITNETEYRDAFTLSRADLNMQREHDRDPTAGIPPIYWYPVGRDHDLERQLADRIREHLNRPEDLRSIVPTG